MNSYERIKKMVEKKMNIEDISSMSRKQRHVKARYLYFKLCQEFLKHRFRLMACSEMVGRQHEMVLYGINVFEDLLDTVYYVDVKKAYTELIVELDIINPDNDKYLLKRITELSDEIEYLKDGLIKNSKVHYETIIN